jgi:mono/diheme cytochrome c family protein
MRFLAKTRTWAVAGVALLATGLMMQTAFAEQDAQDPQKKAAAASTIQASPSDELAGDPSPFPPGRNAMLVKQTCSQCHTPNVVVTQTFTEKTARKYYQKMLGESPDTERGKKIVEYLSTVLGE